MGERKNAFSGELEIKSKVSGKTHSLEVTMPNIDEVHPLVRKKNRNARVNVNLALGRSVDFGNYSFRFSMGGSVDVTEEDFFSGEAHNVVAHHIGDTIIPFVESIDANWIPEALQLEGKLVLVVAPND